MSDPSGRAASPEEIRLYDEARRVAQGAYAPYSGFRVGAVIAGSAGGLHRGVNVENASYPAGVCAERVALGAMVAAGELDPRMVAVATADERDVWPCGLCLQAIAELGAPDIVCRVGGALRTYGLRELLTAPFVKHDGAGGGDR